MSGASLIGYSYVQFGTSSSPVNATITLTSGTTNAILGGYHTSGSMGAIYCFGNLNITTSDGNPYSATLNIIAATRSTTSYAIYLPTTGKSLSISNGNVLIMVDSPNNTCYGIQTSGNINLTRGNIKIHVGTLNTSSISYMLNISGKAYDLIIGKSGDSDDLLMLDCVTGNANSGYNVGLRLNDAHICYVYSGQANIESGYAGGSGGSWAIEPYGGYIQSGGQVHIKSGPTAKGGTDAGSACIRCQDSDVKFEVNGGTLEMESNTTSY